MYIVCTLTNEEFLMSLLNLRGRCFVYFGSEYLHTMRSGYRIFFSQFLSKIYLCDVGILQCPRCGVSKFWPLSELCV